MGLFVLSKLPTFSDLVVAGLLCSGRCQSTCLNRVIHKLYSHNIKERSCRRTVTLRFLQSCLSGLFEVYP